MQSLAYVCGQIHITHDMASQHAMQATLVNNLTASITSIVSFRYRPVRGSNQQLLSEGSVRHSDTASAASCTGPGPREQEKSRTVKRERERNRWQGLDTDKFLYCTCENRTEDDSGRSLQLSGWERHPVSHSACLHRHSTTTIATGGTSGTQLTHSHSNRHHSNTINHCGNNSQTKRTTSVHDIPDIPFNMAGIDSKPSYRGLEYSSAHIEHYLSTYTYPHLEHVLATSLPAAVGVLCSCCAAESSRIRGRREGLLRPSIVRMSLEGPSHQSKSCSHHHAISRKSIQSFHEVHSTPSVLHVPRHPTPLSGTRITTPSAQDIHTTSSTITTHCQPVSHKQYGWTSYSNSKPNTKQPPATSGSYSTAMQVYDMGVRWTPRSFPSFVVSSANAFSNSKPPREIGRKVRKTSSLANTTSNSKSVSKNARALAGTRVHGTKRRARQAAEQGVGKPTVATKTISPFPLITQTAQPLTHTHTTSSPTGVIPPIKLQNQGLVATRREFSHLLRRKRSVSFHSGRPSFRYESLCLEGHSATVNSVETVTRYEDNSVAPNTATDVALVSGGTTPVKIPGPWM